MEENKISSILYQYKYKKNFNKIYFSNKKIILLKKIYNTKNNFKKRIIYTCKDTSLIVSFD
jgi:hypothetical protein